MDVDVGLATPADGGAPKKAAFPRSHNFA